MGYIFLGVSLLCGVTKGYCSKKTSSYINGFKDSIFVNLIRMLLCIIIGFILLVFNSQIHHLKLDLNALWVCALSGFSTSIFVICWMLSVQKNAYMMVDVSLMLGTLVPLIGCRVLYGEQITPAQWLGLLLLLTAVLLMCSYSKTLKGILTLNAIILLILCGLANGLTEFSQKLFIREHPNIPISAFNFYTYVFSFTALFICYAIIAHRSNTHTEKKVNPTSYIGYIVTMAICLFGHSYFHTAAAGALDSAQLYPVSHGCALILSTAMSAICFKEKPSVKSIIGLIITFVSILLMNM